MIPNDNQLIEPVQRLYDTSKNPINRREGHESGLQLNWPIFSLVSFGEGRQYDTPRFVASSQMEFLAFFATLSKIISNLVVP